MEVIVLTERGAALYGALYDKNDWMTTLELANATGKKQLSPNDRSMLERMVQNGYIQKMEVRQKGKIGQPAFLYRCV